MITTLTRRHLLTAALAAGVTVPLGAGRGIDWDDATQWIPNQTAGAAAPA